jgi:transposase-like protein
MSGKRKRTSYTPAFRREAAHLVIDTGRPIAVVAREVGVGEQLLGRWPQKVREQLLSAVQQGQKLTVFWSHRSVPH